LADCYREGLGVPKDLVEAFAYLNLAAAKSQTARAGLTELDKVMTPGQKTAGQLRSKELHAEVTRRIEAKPLEYR
jgi:TPR repeat protein